ncbi:hypothetical protein [Thermocrispum municipale]|uniref:hypothetical protein n=1 Tax=Thermocrispum municipale TaxID=37926 RepID=UPI0005B8476F|nr:hypothetical protein [Thermocrispum municipale]
MIVKTGGNSSRDELRAVRREPEVRHCGWCGARLDDRDRVGRRRRYCGHSCRQRAYEQRIAVQRGGLPEDAVVLSADEIAALQDKLFQLRCAAEDVVTAVSDGAKPAELQALASALASAAKDVEQLR